MPSTRCRCSSSAAPRVIGNHRDRTQPYIGAIDSIRIWNRALTSKDLDETAEEPFDP